MNWSAAWITSDATAPEPIKDLSKLILKSAFKSTLNFTFSFLFCGKMIVFHYQSNRKYTAKLYFNKFIQDWLNMKSQ